MPHTVYIIHIVNYLTCKNVGWGTDTNLNQLKQLWVMTVSKKRKESQKLVQASKVIFTFTKPNIYLTYICTNSLIAL